MVRCLRRRTTCLPPLTCCLRGGSGYDTCAMLTGPEFERGKQQYRATHSMYPEELATVFYKNELSMSTTYLNLYMIYGGTNWGGIAYPGVYSSYDYVRTLGLTFLCFALYPHSQGAAIAEDRTLREKYYELKLQANFLRVSPAYLTTRPMNLDSNQGAFTGNTALVTTQVLDAVGNVTAFYVIRWVSSPLTLFGELRTYSQ